MSEDLARLDDWQSRYPLLFGTERDKCVLELNQGWIKLVACLCQSIIVILESDPNARFRVKQIKEKFGSLRFYYELKGATDNTAHQIRTLVNSAERESEEACVVCGSFGRLCQRDGWLVTLCNRCLANHKSGDQGDDDDL